MLKRITLIPLLFLVATSWAHAQLEALLFGAAGAGINTLMAKGQERTFSTVKVVFDVYYVENDSKLTYLASWDPTTQTTVWFGDRVALKVKSYSNRGPAHDHTIIVNDKTVDWRKVEGGRVVRGKPKGAKGVVGDYPFVYIEDLDMGYNQIKVRVSASEWGQATFIRLDIRQFMQTAEDEQKRLAIAGAGGSTYPVLQSYTAKMPDGSIRNFVSVEEMQLALNGQPTPSTNSIRQDPPAMPGGAPTGTNQGTRPKDEEKEAPLEVFAGLYNFDEVREIPETEARTMLAGKVAEQPPLSESSNSVTIPSGQGLAMLIICKDEFNADLLDPSERIIRRYQPTFDAKTGLYALFIPFHFGAKSTENTLELVGVNIKRTIRFKKN